MGIKPKASTSAQWVVKLNCECPKCKKFVNLLDYPYFWDGRKLDIPEYNTELSNNVEVSCPECYEDFEVCCEW